MITQQMKQKAIALGEAIVKLPGSFVFSSINRGNVLHSAAINQGVGLPKDEYVLGAQDEDFFNHHESCYRIKKIRNDVSAGNVNVSYFSETNNQGYSYSHFLKCSPVLFQQKVVGVFFDLFFIDPEVMSMSSNQTASSNWLAHPDILYQCLLDKTAQNRAFYWQERIIHLSVKETQWLYYRLLGYDDAALSEILQCGVAQVKRHQSAVYNQFKVKSLSELMNFLFSKKLLKSYGLYQERVFSPEFIDKLKRLMFSLA